MTLKTAVIGVGSMGRNHARIYADIPGSRLVGVADTDASAAERIPAWSRTMQTAVIWKRG